MVPYAARQGLAYDLVGDNANAQRVYSRGLAAGVDHLRPATAMGF